MKEAKKKLDVSKNPPSNLTITNLLLIVLLFVILGTYIDSKLAIENLQIKLNEVDSQLDSKMGVTNEKLEILKKVKIASSQDLSLEKIEELNKKADKYHIIYLTKEISTAIDNTTNYSIKLSELQKLIGEKFINEVSELKKYEIMNITSIKNLENNLEKTLYVTNPATSESDFAQQVKGVFRITSKDDKRTPISQEDLNLLLNHIREKNEWEAMEILEKLDKKNDQVKLLIEDLKLRNDLKYHLKTIADGTFE